MSQDNAPEWASKAAQAVNSDIVNDTGNDVEIIALALTQAYKRGQESMRERAGKELDAWKMPKASDKVRSLPIEQEGGE